MENMKEAREWGKAVQPIVDFYESRIKQLIILLYQKGCKQTEIAKARKVSKQAINIKYPKKKLLKEANDAN
jgi:hypothetical protein